MSLTADGPSTSVVGIRSRRPTVGPDDQISRKAQHERRTLSFLRRDQHLAAVVRGDVTHDRQAEAGAAGVAAAGLVDAIEALEHPVEVAARESRCPGRPPSPRPPCRRRGCAPGRRRRDGCTSPRSRRGCRPRTSAGVRRRGSEHVVGRVERRSISTPRPPSTTSPTGNGRLRRPRSRFDRPCRPAAPTRSATA